MSYEDCDFDDKHNVLELICIIVATVAVISAVLIFA